MTEKLNRTETKEETTKAVSNTVYYTFANIRNVNYIFHKPVCIIQITRT